MADSSKWVALGYNLPAEPSKTRVYIWRKIKDMGAVHLRPGIVVIPNDAMNKNKFVALRDKIIELGGEAELVYISFFDKTYENRVINKFNSAAKDEYRQIEENCNHLLSSIANKDNKPKVVAAEEELKKVAQKYGKAKSRDHFSLPEGKNIENSINNILKSLRSATDDFVASIRKYFDKYNSGD